MIVFVTASVSMIRKTQRTRASLNGQKSIGIFLFPEPAACTTTFEAARLGGRGVGGFAVHGPLGFGFCGFRNSGFQVRVPGFRFSEFRGLLLLDLRLREPAGKPSKAA